jgi:hypothetical protein
LDLEIAGVVPGDLSQVARALQPRQADHLIAVPGLRHLGVNPHVPDLLEATARASSTGEQHGLTWST